MPSALSVVTPARPDTAADPAQQQRRRFRGAWLLPPLLAYLAGHVVYSVATALVSEAHLTVDSRVRADSGLYALIASQGYDLFLCDSDPDLGPMFAPGAWC